MGIENVNNPTDYNVLNELSKEILLNWIKENFIDSISYFEESSYALKHRFENSLKGFYITNGQFKGAMLQAGYHPKDANETNWLFRVELIEKCKVISSPFNFWLKEQIDRNDCIGDVANDTFNDLNGLIMKQKKII